MVHLRDFVLCSGSEYSHSAFRATSRYWRPAVAICLLACSDSLAPGERVPLLGQYEYSMAIPARQGVTQARTYTGTLVITSAEETSIWGTWAVSGYDAEVDLWFWTAGGYTVHASASGAGLMNHRLYPEEGGFRCEGSLLVFDGTGNPLGFTPVIGQCTVRYRP